MIYFVSYVAYRGAVPITGRCDFAAGSPITGSDRLDVIEEQLKRDYGFDTVTVTGWQRYEDSV